MKVMFKLVLALAVLPLMGCVGPAAKSIVVGRWTAP